jgi:hypothetical protein
VRASLRRRLRDFLGRASAARLFAILRSAALAGAVAAALAAPGAASAQVALIPPVELSAIARGEGGFVVRGEGEPASRCRARAGVSQLRATSTAVGSRT